MVLKSGSMSQRTKKKVDLIRPHSFYICLYTLLCSSRLMEENSVQIECNFLSR